MDDGSEPISIQANPGWYLARRHPEDGRIEMTGIIAWCVWAGSGEPIVEAMGVKGVQNWGRGIDWAIVDPNGKVTSDLGHFDDLVKWAEARAAVNMPGKT